MRILVGLVPAIKNVRQLLRWYSQALVADYNLRLPRIGLALIAIMATAATASKARFVRASILQSPRDVCIHRTRTSAAG